MVAATRAMYLVSGLIVLVTGIYVDWRFADIISDLGRLIIGLVAFSYFVVQFCRFLSCECTKRVDRSSVNNVGI